MANITIDTQSAQYQQYLTAIQNIRSFYGPRLAKWLRAPEDFQALWRANDPILDELVTIHEKMTARETIE